MPSIVKLNEAFSGQGNALVDLRGLPPPGAPDEAFRIEDRLRVMRCELAGMSYEAFCERLEQLGGVVEEWIVNELGHAWSGCSAGQADRAILAAVSRPILHTRP